MKKNILFSLIVLFIFNACSVRPTVEDKSNYMNDVIYQLEKENHFKDNALGYDGRIIYNRDVLSLKKEEFLNLFNIFIEKRYKKNLNNLTISVTTPPENYNDISITTLNYDFGKIIIICTFTEGYLYGYGKQVSFDCVKK